MSEVSAEVQARRDLAAAHRLAVLENLHEGTWNHFSLKHPERRGQMLITPGHIHFSQVTASNLVVMDGAGEMVSGDRAPNMVAWALHYPVQRARPD